MSTTPVPSLLPEDFLLNVRAIDEFCGSTDATLTNRLGVSLPTIHALISEFPSASSNAAIALEQAGIATTQAVLAAESKALAELARDASFVTGPKYPTKEIGRLAVADGVNFLVQGSGDVAAYEYRRTNSTTSVLIASYPSVAALQNLRDEPIRILSNVGGTANAITTDLPSGMTAYVQGQLFYFVASAANTTSAPTLKIGTLAAMPLVDEIGGAVQAADIEAGKLYFVRVSTSSSTFRIVASHSSNRRIFSNTTLTGAPTAPTPADTDSSTRLATTAMAQAVAAKIEAKRTLSYSPNLYTDPEFSLLADGQTQSWTGGTMTAERRKGAMSLRTPAGGSAVALASPYAISAEALPSGLLSVSVVIREKESTAADANFRLRIEAENSAGNPIVTNGTWPTAGNGDGVGQRWEKNLAATAITAPTVFVVADAVPIALPVAAGAVRFRLIIREQTTGKVWLSHINVRDGIDSTYAPPRATATSTLSTAAVLKSTTSLPNGAQGQNTAGGGFTCTGLDRIGATGTYAGCWIVGNDGRIGPDTITTGPEAVNNCSVLILSPDFSRIVKEYNIKGNSSDFPSAGSIQGVAWDSSDDTIWFAEQGSKKVYHINMAGVKLAGTLDVTSIFDSSSYLPNGIAYDATNDALWLGQYATQKAFRVSCATGSVQATLATALAFDHDQLGYDESTGYLYYSRGANGYNAEVYVVLASTGAGVRSWAGLEMSQAAEGVFIDWSKKQIYVVNDGGFHAAAKPPLAMAVAYEFAA